MTEDGSRRPPKHGWTGYYDKLIDRPPRRTLLYALSLFEGEDGRPADAPRLAVDLGSGGGRDAVELLRRGWSVLALDAAPEAAVALWNRPDLPRSGALVDRQSTRLNSSHYCASRMPSSA